MHERQVGVHALELGVLILQLAQLRHLHARELALPLVLHRLAQAMLSAGFIDLRAKFDFPQDAADDLRFTESGLLHVETQGLGILYHRVVQVS